MKAEIKLTASQVEELKPFQERVEKDFVKGDVGGILTQVDLDQEFMHVVYIPGGIIARQMQVAIENALRADG